MNLSGVPKSITVPNAPMSGEAMRGSMSGMRGMSARVAEGGGMPGKATAIRKNMIKPLKGGR